MYNRSEADARYRNKNRAAYNERIASWKKNNRKKNLESNRKSRVRRREKIAEYNAKYRAENAEAIKKYNAEYYVEHKEEFRVRLNGWRKENPEKEKAQIHNRRARKTQAGGSFTAEEWKALCKEHRYKCLCCGKRRKLTPDHVISIAKGGTSDIRNIQPLCQPCNSKKSIACTDYRKDSA